MPMQIIMVRDMITGVQTSQFELRDGDTVIYTGGDVLNELKQYEHFYCKHNNFNLYWSSFKNVDWKNYLKVYKSFEMSYNPIHNYDNTEKSVDAVTHGDEIVTTNPDTTQVITQPARTTTRNYYTTDENANSRLADYSESAIGNGDTTDTTTTYSGIDTQTTTHTSETVNFTVDDITQTTADIINTHVLTKQGNIGVTTTQQLLESELNLRKQILLSIMIEAFARKYFFIGGVPNDIDIVYN